MKIVKNVFIGIVAVALLINIMHAYFFIMEAPSFQMHYRAKDGHCEVYKYKMYSSNRFDGGCNEH